MTVLDCCRIDVVTASPDAKVNEVAELMSDSNVGCVVITNDLCPVGIVTDRDIVTRVLAPGKDPKKTAISEVMTRDPVVVEDGTGLFEAMQLIRDEWVRGLPIIDGDGRLAGIITLDDIIRLIGQEMQYIGDVIREASPAE
ncbi:MAG: CBS domain-containing protein [Methanoregulaceae archaeon]|nr:CBS domain-containing protein [Methanoregulaceae archaeon]